MATTEEIERRVQQADAARSARRAAAARQVSDLAQRRAALAEQLDDLDRELGDVLADVQEVMDVDELAAFTDLPVADLNRWLAARTSRTPARPARKRPAKATDPGGRRSARTPAPTTSASTTAATAAPPAEPRTSAAAGAADLVRVPAEVA